MPKRSCKNPNDKPSKPYRDFPMYAHATKRWAKRIRGTIHYFGPWGDPDGALRRYLEQKDDLHAGRTPRLDADSLTLRHVCNKYLTAKLHKANAGEIKRRTFNKYYAVAAHLIDAWGANRLVDDLNLDDFGRLRAQLAKRLSPTALNDRIQIVRGLFKYAYEAALLDRPQRFGPDFAKASRKVVRQARNAQPIRMFEAEEIRKLLDVASIPMRAMILLGVNAGWGQSDVSALPQSAIDLDKAIADYPRVKTATKRRAPLWKETVKAIKDAIDARPKPNDKADAGLVFITRFGRRWVRDQEHENGKAVPIDSIGLEFGKLLRSLGLKRPGLNFYGLRHSFRTIADEATDRPAIDLIMGHTNGDDIAVYYRERISEERLRRITDHVHKWLFGKNKSAARRGKMSNRVGG